MSTNLFSLAITQAWQIAVLAVIVAALVRLTARNRPHVAHTLWMLVLIKCITPPVWGHSLGVFSQLQAILIDGKNIRSGTIQDFSSTPNHRLLAEESVMQDSPSRFIQSETASDESVGNKVTANSLLAPPDRDLSRSDSIPQLSDREESFASRWPQIGLAIAVIGAIVTLGLMIGRCAACLRSIYRHRTTEFDSVLQERLRSLSSQLRIRRIPGIIVSDALFGPAVLGLLRHTIVLPRCLLKAESRSSLPGRTSAEGGPVRNVTLDEDRPEDAECTRVAASREVLPGRQDLQFLDPILAHELLHIRRGDLRTGTLQTIVQSLWWFHPAVWFCSRCLSREAERCCDEQVIAELGCSPAQYARSLLSVIECKHRLQPVPVFPGMKPVEITSQRMERIMSLKNGLRKRTPAWCWLIIVALAIVVLPGAEAQISQEDATPSPPSTTENALTTATEPTPLTSATSSDVKQGLNTVLLAEEPTAEIRTDRVQTTYAASKMITRLAKERSLDRVHASELLRDLVAQKLNSLVTVSGPGQGATQPPTVTMNGELLIVIQSRSDAKRLIPIIELFEKCGFYEVLLSVRVFILPIADARSILDEKTIVRPEPAPPADFVKPQTTAPSAETISSNRHIRATIMSETQLDALVPTLSKATEYRQQLASCVAIHNGQTEIFQAPIPQQSIQSEVNMPDSENPLQDSTLRLRPEVIGNGLISLRCSLEKAAEENKKPECTIVQCVTEPAAGKSLVFHGLTHVRSDGTRNAVVIAVTPVQVQPCGTPRLPDPVGNSSRLSNVQTPSLENDLQTTLVTYCVSDLIVIKRMVVPAGAKATGVEPTVSSAVYQAIAVAPSPANDRNVVEQFSASDLELAEQSVKADFAPLMELIKASVEPDSWRRDGPWVEENAETLSLVIRQNTRAHQKISKLLSLLRNAQDQSIQVSCRLMKLNDDSQCQWLTENYSFHPLTDGTQWALVAQQRNETLLNALREQQFDVISCPRIMTIEGQTAFIEVSGDVTHAQEPKAFRMEMTPHLLPQCDIIRLQHREYFGDDATRQVHESLVGSGQTLLLLIENPLPPQKDDASPSHYLVMMTPERIKLPADELPQAVPADAQ